MPAPRHVKVTWSGTLGTANPAPEIWSMGLSITPGTLAAEGDHQVDLDVLQASVAAMASAFTTHFGTGCSAAVGLRNTRLSYVGDNGRTLRTNSGAYVHADAGSTFQCSGAHPNVPFQTAAVISTSAVREHRTGRGRMYLPVPAYGASESDGLMTVTSQQNIATKADGLITNVRTAAQAGWGGFPCIASGGSAVDGFPPALLPIITIRVGRALDTISRRRNSLNENYTLPIDTLN